MRLSFVPVTLFLLFNTAPALMAQPDSHHPPITMSENYSPAEQAEAYLITGQKELEAGEVDAAINSFVAGQRLQPEDGRFSLMLALAYQTLSQTELVETHLLEAARLMPSADDPLHLLFRHYYMAGDLAAAEPYLVELIRRHPGDEQLTRNLEKLRLEMTVEQEMESDLDNIFTIRIDGALDEEISALAIEALQDAYAEQGSLLNHYPQKQVQVILYLRDDYDMMTGSPPWSAGRFDGKIRIPIAAGALDSTLFQTILFHEYNHFLAQQLSGGRAPAWFYEGLAMVAESSQHQCSLRYLASAVGAGQLVPFSRLEKSFLSLDQEQVSLAYEQSYSFVSYLREQFGWHTLKDLLLAYDQERSTENAFVAVFSGFGLDFNQLVREWESSL